jgi:hypothetical protein
MIFITRIKEASKEFIKVLRSGKQDVVTADQYLPYGIDSKPIKDILGLFAQTAGSETAVFGYKTNTETTKEGEIRIYATDSAGIEQFSALFKNDGTVEFGGTADNFVRYLKLNQGLQNFVTDLNAKLVTAFTGVGGSWPGTTINISDSKINEIKTL